MLGLMLAQIVLRNLLIDIVSRSYLNEENLPSNTYVRKFLLDFSVSVLADDEYASFVGACRL